ncbi:metalloregulator ArsR/SmtB family transcription factor [Haloechinothrix sp. YIM 98757]|uniref:Metalloregulator ArsR/SmtB family transcription factor n=1 Tax=Haloechinothrix aidingensis TaxID=2752311 RepID=A0A838A664_9PSEU|nr:metalloregulator ArsR/SmtB family transcription factor [Haloechinothrix aidingensis]MBA0124305.1 metalloregulator ArsR/SmtB family transcription factor [Haloechinothrix aidingensis]
MARESENGGVGSRDAKNALFDGLATVAKALASGRRAEILDLLTQGARSVEQVADAIDQSVANTSHHLQVLAGAGLVESQRDGQRVRYRLAGARVAELWAAMRDVAAQQVSEVERLASAYLGDRGDLEGIGRAELERRINSGEAVVLDVRPRLEYESGHIPGARSAPLSELDEALAALPRDIDVVAYCRGPYCVFADEAVRKLRAAGYDARRLEDGFPEWEREGRPVTRP